MPAFQRVHILRHAYNTFVCTVLREMCEQACRQRWPGVTCECIDELPLAAPALSSEASSDDDSPARSTTLYILPIGESLRPPLPPYYIVYQFEQLKASRVVTSAYADIIADALQCWEYTHANVTHYRSDPRFKRCVRAHRDAYETVMRRMRRQTISWMPTPLLPDHRIFSSRPPARLSRIDVLFYGVLNPRRRAVLARLNLLLVAHRYRLVCVDKTYGAALHDLIRRARVVVHLNFFPRAILATYRLNEVVSHGRVVVAERPDHPDDTINYKMYQTSGVQFFDVCPAPQEASALRTGVTIAAIDTHLCAHVWPLLRTALHHPRQYAQWVAQGRLFARIHAATYQTHLNEQLQLAEAQLAQKHDTESANRHSSEALST